jgi:hypothetical protein
VSSSWNEKTAASSDDCTSASVSKQMKLLMKVGAKFKYSYVSKSGGKLLFEYTFGRGEWV